MNLHSDKEAFKEIIALAAFDTAATQQKGSRDPERKQKWIIKGSMSAGLKM